MIVFLNQHFRECRWGPMRESIFPPLSRTTYLTAQFLPKQTFLVKSRGPLRYTLLPPRPFLHLAKKIFCCNHFVCTIISRIILRLCNTDDVTQKLFEWGPLGLCKLRLRAKDLMETNLNWQRFIYARNT